MKLPTAAIIAARVPGRFQRGCHRKAIPKLVRPLSGPSGGQQRSWRRNDSPNGLHPGSFSLECGGKRSAMPLWHAAWVVILLGGGGSSPATVESRLREFGTDWKRHGACGSDSHLKAAWHCVSRRTPRLAFATPGTNQLAPLHRWRTRKVLSCNRRAGNPCPNGAKGDRPGHRPGCHRQSNCALKGREEADGIGTRFGRIISAHPFAPEFPVRAHDPIGSEPGVSPTGYRLWPRWG